MRILCSITTLVLLLCPLALWGQESPVLSLEQAINIALNKSYTIKRYNERKLSAEHNYKYWEAQFKPKLDYTLSSPSWNERVIPISRVDGLPVYNSTGLMSYSSDLKFTYTIPTGGNFILNSQFYRENNKTVLAQQDYRTLTSRKAQSSFRLSFSQPIFTRNKLREGLDEARLWFEKSSSEFNRQQLDIIYQVTKSFYDVVSGTHKVEIDSEKLRNSEEAYRIAKLMSEAGRIPEVTVFSKEVEVAQYRADLSESEGRLERSKDLFKQLIGLSLFDEFRIKTSLDYDTLSIDSSLAIEKALASRREIVESELDIKLARINLDKARRVREFSGCIDAYYDITGVSTLEHGSSADLFESSFDNIDDRPPNRGITLKLSYPIFDWGRGKRKVQRSMADLRATQLDLENQRTDIIREVRNIVRSVEEARNRLEIQEQSEELAQTVYRISLLSFEHGGITSQELAREQEILTNAQLSYLDAYITYQLALADLQRKTIWDFKTNTSYLEASCFRTEEY